jgi:ubiquinone/menaquinone biosynthesis C-methylase UbiE
MIFLKWFGDNTNKNSPASKARRKRHLFFLEILKNFDGKIRILDIGGTESYWESMDFNNENVEITLLNLFKVDCKKNNFNSVVGDATNMSEYQDSSFDLVFSNSCIEHLFTDSNQKKMASEIIRVGRSYFIQTPNKYFPLEPHFLFPLFQFLPNFLKLFLLQNFRLGHIGRIKDREKAQIQINEIKLISKSGFKELFPEANFFEEKFLFFTKSFIAYHNK